MNKSLAQKQDASVSLKINAVKIDSRVAGIAAVGLVFNKV
jgi:hypothetical protein